MFRRIFFVVLLLHGMHPVSGEPVEICFSNLLEKQPCFDEGITSLKIIADRNFETANSGSVQQCLRKIPLWYPGLQELDLSENDFRGCLVELWQVFRALEGLNHLEVLKLRGCWQRGRQDLLAEVAARSELMRRRGQSRRSPSHSPLGSSPEPDPETLESRLETQRALFIPNIPMPLKELDLGNNNALTADDMMQVTQFRALERLDLSGTPQVFPGRGSRRGQRPWQERLAGGVVVVQEPHR